MQVKKENHPRETWYVSPWIYTDFNGKERNLRAYKTKILKNQLI